LLVVAQVAACVGPSRIDPGTCGNGVLEPGEDCDTWTDPTLGAGTACMSCRYVCDTPERVCPSGWGCSGDEICRFPSGRWDSVTLVDDPALNVTVGRVNDDEHPDLFGTGPLGLWCRFGGPDLRFTERVSLSGSPTFGLPTFADLNDDDQLDSVIPVVGAFFVAAGSAAGFDSMAQATIEPNPPFVDGLVLVPVVTDLAAPFHDALAMFANGDISALALVTNELVPVAFAQIDPYRTTAEIRGLAIGDIDPGPESGEDVAITFAGEPRAYLFSTGRRGGARYLEAGLQPWVALPAAVDEGLGLAFADVDRDGAVDLLAPAGTGVAVAYGDGLGSFSPAAEDLRFAGLGWPLAIGDLDADGAADYVYPDGMYLDGSGVLVNRASGLFSMISRAAIGDFNRDGVNDVALSIDSPPVLDVVFGSALGYFSNPAAYQLDSPAAIIRSGDFDGDHTDDVIFVQRSPLGDPLSVIFGATNLPFPDPQLMGRFETVLDVQTALLGLPGLSSDTTTDLLVMSSRTGAPDEILGIYVVFGTASRVMASGFNLGFDARAIFAAPFSPGADAQPDIIAITQPVTGHQTPEVNGSTLQLIHGRGDAHFHDSDRRYLHSAAIEGGTLVPGIDCTFWASGDVDGDGRHEIVGLSRCGDTQPALYWASIGGDDVAPELVEHVEAITDRTGPRSLTLGDVDGDGALDAIVTWDEGIAVYWNEGGTLSAGSAAQLPAFSPDAAWTGAAIINADGDPARELAIVSPAGVLIAEAAGRTLSLGSGNVAEGGQRIWVGDVNEDQLDDLLVARGERVEVLVAVPHDE
jgi:hypothetical protein